MKLKYLFSILPKVAAWAILWHYGDTWLLIALVLLDVGDSFLNKFKDELILDGCKKIIENVVRIGHGEKPIE